MNQDSPSAMPPPAPRTLTESERLVAMLCYVTMMIIPFIYPVVVLLSRRRTRFQTYHATQSLVLGAAMSGFWGCLIFLSLGFIWAIPPFGLVMAASLLCLVPFSVGMSILIFLYFAYKAYKGEYAQVPVLSQAMQSSPWAQPPD